MPKNIKRNKKEHNTIRQLKLGPLNKLNTMLATDS